MLSDDDLEAYRRDGVVVVKGAIAGEELRLLREAADALTEEAVAYGRALDERGAIRLDDDHGFREWDEQDDRKLLFGRAPDGSRLWRRANDMWTRDSIYRIVSANPVVLGIVEQVVGEPVLPVDAAVVAKMPGGGAAVPWHRDPPGEMNIREGADAAPDFVVDIYLDASTRDNGCLWARPGSHRWTENESDSLDFSVPGAITVEAEPGDMLLHCTGVLHGSPRNESGAMRRTLYLYFAPPSWFERFAVLDPPSVDVQRRLLAQMIDERAASGLDGSHAGAV
jgi:ectoine hydroxylase-related dioxygenase (phytanoyl-CoA dioxygenase family)